MNTNVRRFFELGRAAAVGVALVTLVACGALDSSPEQVEASNPTVSYRYRGDDELIKTNQLAVTFCNRYQYIPRAVSFRDDRDGYRYVDFECVPASSPTTPRFDPNLTYTYRTDQELLDASRTAQVYCMNNRSSPEVVSSVVTNNDGSKTVTFQCRSN